MKSEKEELIRRGFLQPGAETEFWTLCRDDMVQLLKSQIATNRTLGARLLSKTHEPVAEELIHALRVEKKLYPKLEICRALVSHASASVNLLIAELGNIGSNQHKIIPEKEFAKDNYPLPRDIASRTLAHIGKSALPELVKTMGSNNVKQLSEALDAVGFICFYNHQPLIFEQLKACFIQNGHNDLICWKIVRAMSGFSESISFLSEQKAACQNERIQKEIDRSLRLIENRKTKKE